MATRDPQTPSPTAPQAASQTARPVLPGRRRGVSPADLAEIPIGSPAGEQTARMAADHGGGRVEASAPEAAAEPVSANVSATAETLSAATAKTAAAQAAGPASTALSVTAPAAVPRPATGHALEVLRPVEPPLRMPPPMPPSGGPVPQWRAGGALWSGVLALVLLLGGLGLWSTQARLSSAVVTSGMINVESNRQVIQHPDGGVVGEILVKDGDTVRAGDVLIRLDGARLQSELAVVDGQLSEIAARKARMEAERDGRDSLTFPDAVLQAAATSADVARQIDGEKTLFQTRREALAQQTALLAEQNAQIENRITGTEAQRTALREQITLMDSELVDQERLLEQRLTQSAKVLELQRGRAGLAGQLGQLEAEIAELRGKLAENGIGLVQLETQRQEEASATLRDLQFQEIELTERKSALSETLSRLDIRAPASGVVYNSQIFAVQAVVEAAQPIMYIIPQDKPLVIVVRVDSINIDEIYMGQEASLRFSAFDQRRIPEILGEISQISADALTDERTGASFYNVEIVPRADELAKLGDHVLLPGMPVEAFVKTGERTVLAYLIHPLTAFFDRSFRE